MTTNTHPAPLPWPARLVRAYCHSMPLQRGKMRLLRWAARRCLATGIAQRRAPLRCGYQIHCDLSGLIQQQLLFSGTYLVEQQQLADWRRQAKTSRTIVDVGANLGIYSLEACAANPLAEVLAIEPTPSLVQQLRQTLAINQIQHLDVLQAALGCAVGHALLQFCDGMPPPGSAGNEGMNFITSAAAGAARTIPVALTTLDRVAARRGWSAVDLIKIDVQGQEAAVLKGARLLLARQAIHCLFIELNGLGCGEAGDQVIRILQGHGYGFRPAGRCRWALGRPGPWLADCSDVVAMPLAGCSP